MTDQLKRFILLIPERYQIDAEECAVFMIQKWQSLSSSELVRVQKASSDLDKTVELCNILAEKTSNGDDKPAILQSFLDAIDHVVAANNNNTASSAKLAIDLRREIALSRENKAKFKRAKVQYYGNFPALPSSVYLRNEEPNFRTKFQRICKTPNPACLFVYGQKGVGKTTFVRHLLADESFIVEKCGVDMVFWLHCGCFTSPTSGLFDDDHLHAELLAGLQIDFGASCYSPTKCDSTNSDIVERLKNAASQHSLVLVILDNPPNASVVELVLKIGISVRCLVITSEDKATITNISGNYTAEDIAVDKLTGEDVRTMFRTCCPLPTSLLPTSTSLGEYQVSTLIDCTAGLPFLAALISANLNINSGIQGRFARLTKNFNARINPEDIMRSEIEGEMQQNAVYLIQECLALLSPINRQCCETFLLFNLGQPVEIDDLAVLWNCVPEKATEICNDLRRRGFLLATNHIELSGSKVTRKFYIHPVIFSTVLENNSHSSLSLNKLKIMRSKLVVHPNINPLCNGENVMHRAVKNRRPLILKTLMTNIDTSTILPQICFEATGDNRQTPLHYLYSTEWRIGQQVTSNETNCSLSFFCQFVDKMAQLNMQDTLDVVNLPDYNGKSLAGRIENDVLNTKRTEDNVLFMAARDCYLSLASLLLQCINVNFNDVYNENGDPALLIAARSGKTGIVQLLISSPDIGIDVNTRNRVDGFTALMIAALRHDRQMAQLFFDCKASSDYTGNESFHDGVVINATNNNGDTALHLAATHGDAEFIFDFLQAGANVNDTNSRGETVLLQLARKSSSINDSTQIASELIACGADVNISNEFDYTPLMLVETTEMAEMLLQQPSIQINVRNKHTHTALMEASQRGKVDIVRLILEHLIHNANHLPFRKEDVIDAQAITTGMTSLMMACKKGHTDVVKLLLEYRANVDIQNQEGETALVVATGVAGNREIVDLFVKHATNSKSIFSNASCVLQ